MYKGIGSVLKEARLQKGISLRELSDQIGISHAYVNKLEKGINPQTGREVTPTMDTIVKIANGLSIPVKELLDQCGYFEPDENDTALDIHGYISDTISTLMNREFLNNGEPVPRQKLELLANAIEVGLGLALNVSSQPAAAPSDKAPRP